MHVNAKDVFEEFKKRAINERVGNEAEGSAQVLATLILADRVDQLWRELMHRRGVNPGSAQGR